MKKRIFSLLKIIALISIVILLIEFVYIFFSTKSNSLYFDSINSTININKGYIAVGSNNNNDMHFEKAKLTKYNLDREKEFEKIYNKGYNGVFFDVAEDDEGNLIAVGSFEANEKDHMNGNRLGLVVKYDSEGNLLYDATFEVLDNSKFTSVEICDDGYIVTGQSIYDNMNVGLSEDGGAYIIKYNKELEIDWKSNFGDSKSAIYNDIVILDKYIYTVGVTDNIIGVISKYNLKGKLIKSSKYKYTDNLGFTGITRLEDNLVVSSGKTTTDHNIDGAILKYNLDLKLVDKVIYKEDGNERFNQIVVDKNNNIIVIGTSAKIDNTEFNKNANVFTHDGLIGKYDSSLEKIAVVHYGDDRDDYFTDVLLSNNNYLVSGYSSYEDGSYLNKFIIYSDALKILEVG